MLLLYALFRCRIRRGSWAYILWLLAYLPLMGFIADLIFFHLRPYQLLPLLIPIVAVPVQLAWPTLFGWAVVVIPSVFCAGVMVFFVVLTAPARVQQHELAALVTSSVVAGVYVLVCAALWFARPKLAKAAVPEPNASPSAGSAGAPPASVS
jgi:hypothetical protein